MLVRLIKVLTISLLCAVLVGGSFVEDNFGLTQTRIELPAGWPRCDFCFPDDQIDFNQSLTPDTGLIILAALVALILSLPHFISGMREDSTTPSNVQRELYTPWEAPFKKRKRAAVLPKRHARYYGQRA